MKGYNRRVPQKKEYHLIGYAIRSPKVICIDHNNINHGEIPIEQAVKIATDAGLQLVQVSVAKSAPNAASPIPTCRILDYSKFRYEFEKRQKAQQKKQRENAIKFKEIKIRPATDDNDLKIKAKAAQSFIEEGNRVKVSVWLKGRELSHKDLAIQQLKTFVSFIPNATLSNEPQIDGKRISAILTVVELKKAV